MVGKNLKRIMQEKGIKSSVLVKETGFSKAAISQYLNDINTPSPERLETIAKILDVAVEELTGVPGPPEVAVPSHIPIRTTTLSIKQAATLLHKHESYIRQGLREGRPGFEYGSAVKTSGKWSYCIYANKFAEITGIPVNI